jgi:electron transfer flavoprotein alpha subunit
MKILLLAEHDNRNIKRATLHTLTAALQISSDIDILIVGNQTTAVAKQAALLPQVTQVLVADAPEYEHQLAENTASLIAEIGKQYAYILAPATTFGKNILPRCAALLDTAMVADVIKIISANTFVRPIYAGNALATIQCDEAIKILTIRTTAFASCAIGEKSAPIISLSLIIPNHLTQFEHEELHISARPELTAAKIIVAGGRGLKSVENFKLLETLADKLGAAIGASRAAVDAGFAPNDFQVGQTGKVVAPDLYIAIGISGAIQHIAGMKDSKVIVAINNDADAPIFQIADYGLVTDLFSALKELNQELEKNRQ